MKKWQKMKHFRHALKIALFSTECADLYLQRHHIKSSFNSKLQQKKHKGYEPCFIGGICE